MWFKIIYFTTCGSDRFQNSNWISTETTKCFSTIFMHLTNNLAHVTAVLVLSGISEIQETLLVTPANDSGNNAFQGWQDRHRQPILVGLWRGKTLQLPDTKRILLLNGLAQPAPSKDSHSYSTLLPRLWHMRSGTRIQLIYRHSPDGFWRSAAWWLSQLVETW